MTIRQAVIAATATILAASAGASSARAGIIDDLNDSSLFVCWSGGGNPVYTTAMANGNGTVTLTRTGNNGIDSGANWHSVNPIPLSTDYDTLIITPTAPLNSGDNYMITIHYFAATGFTIAPGTDEWTWINSSTSTSTQTLASVMAHAPAGAGSYYVKFRMGPNWHATEGFTFDSIAAVPEPASCGLLVLGGLVLARRKKTRAL